jgi:tetratricopeptide (TPR) repeat protein
LEPKSLVVVCVTLMLIQSASAAAVCSIEQANELLNHRKFSEALEVLDTLARSEPNNGKVYLDRAIALGELHRYDEALGDLEKAKELEPGNWRVFRTSGVINRMIGNFEEALTDLNAAVTIDPKIQELYVQRGYCYLRLGVYRRNLISIANVFDASERFATPSPKSLFEKSLTDYDQAIRMNPKDALARAAQGDCLEKLNRLPDAMASFNKAIQLDRKNLGALLGRASVCCKLEKFQQAVDDCTTIIEEVNPTYPAAYKQRSIALHGLGKHDLAQEDLSKFDSLSK